MSYIPSSTAEVKRIIEAANFKTHDVDLYEMTDCGICEKPFRRIPGGLKAILDEPDGRVFIGHGPDMATILSGPPELPPPYPPYTGDLFMYFERAERFGRAGEEVLARLGVSPAPEGSPKENLREASLRSERPRKNKTGRPATESEKVVPVPAPQEVAPPLHSVGRELKLAWLPGELYESPSFCKLKLGEQELYRIYRTYCKVAGGESKNSYISISIVQAAELLERRKKDMIGSGNSVTRKAAVKIGTCERSIIRYSLTLQKAGWIKKPVRGRPREVNPYCNKYLIVKSEKQRLRLKLEEKKKVIH